MQSVIVSVKLQGQPTEYDLEVPADVPARKLAELITHNINPQAAILADLTVRCLRPGSARSLPSDVSLAEAGLWDGVLLEIGPQGKSTDPNWVDILIGWVPIDEPGQPGWIAPVARPAAKPAPAAKSAAASKPAPAAKPAPPATASPVDTPADDVEWLPLFDTPQPTHPAPDDSDEGWKPAR